MSAVEENVQSAQYVDFWNAVLDNAKPTLMIHFTQLKLYSEWPRFD